MCLQGKAPLRQADPLKAAMVASMEQFMMHSVSGADKAFVGYTLFLLHTRARYSDGQQLEAEPEVEGEWLEAPSPHTKLAHRNPARRHMLLVGLAAGSTGDNRAVKWLGAIVACGLRAGPGFFTSP